jgi:hypothetical protein
MKLTMVAAICALAAVPALAATSDLVVCAKEPQTQGLRQRVDNLRALMERIELTTERADQRRLLELHAKSTHEAMQQIRRREATVACRQELMHALMEQVLRYQVALYEAQ